jgi:hypothetical protein
LNRRWPRFEPPPRRSLLTIGNVIGALQSENYRGPIMEWARSVWDSWKTQRDEIDNLVKNSIELPG